MFINILFHLCQSDCLYRFQLYMFCALCVTHGGNYKRYRLRVRLAGVFDSRVIDIDYMCVEGCVRASQVVCSKQPKFGLTQEFVVLLVRIR